MRTRTPRAAKAASSLRAAKTEHAPGGRRSIVRQIDQRALGAAGMQRIREAFVASARRAIRLGVDGIEIHGAPEAGDSLIEPGTGRFQLRLEKCHIAIPGRERCGALDWLRRGIEFAEPEVRQAEVRGNRLGGESGPPGAQAPAR